VCDREAAEKEAEENEEWDTESKTRTPHKDVGKKHANPMGSAKNNGKNKKQKLNKQNCRPYGASDQSLQKWGLRRFFFEVLATSAEICQEV